MMKKIQLLLFLSLSFSAFTQGNHKVAKNSIKFIPHKMIYNSLAIGYEREISPTTSLYFLSQIIYSEKGKNYNKGLAQSIGFKKYIAKGKEVLHISPSFYFMPYLQAGSFNIQEKLYIQSNNQNDPETYFYQVHYLNYGGGFLMGFGLTLMRRIGVDIYFGGEAMFIDHQQTNELSDGNYNPRSQDLWEGVRGKGGFEFSYNF